MKATYKGATFEGTPEEVTRAIRMMDEPRVTYYTIQPYPQDSWYVTLPHTTSVASGQATVVGYGTLSV